RSLSCRNPRIRAAATRSRLRPKTTGPKVHHLDRASAGVLWKSVFRQAPQKFASGCNCAPQEGQFTAFIEPVPVDGLQKGKGAVTLLFHYTKLIKPTIQARAAPVFWGRPPVAFLAANITSDPISHSTSGKITMAIRWPSA